MPVEFLFGFSGVGVEFREIARAARGEFVGERFIGNLFESMDHFENGGGVASAEVVSGETGF